MVKLQIGLIGYHPGWELLLQQIGISYQILKAKDLTKSYSVIIIAETVPELDDYIIEYVRNGGALLCTTPIPSKFNSGRNKIKFVKYLIPQKNSNLLDTNFLDIYDTCLISSYANTVLSNDKEPAIYFGEYGSGYMIVLPFNAGKIVLDNRSMKKSFYSSNRRLPFEHVSTISKGTLRRLITKSLELLYHSRGLPFIHRWLYPKDSKSIFSLRIDTDGASQKEVKLLSDKFSLIPLTWFLDIKSQQYHIDEFKTMSNVEIGIHCFNHCFHSRYDEIKNDIQMAMVVANKHFINCCGYASPFGRWNNDLGKALEDLNFKYSSEFSYDYDNLPSSPYIKNKFSKVLQLPVHPICIGNLRRLGYNELEMKKYFHFIIDQKITLSELLVFYHHPKSRYEAVLEDMIQYVRQHRIPFYKFIDYVNWWNKRISIKEEISLNNDEIIIKSEDIYDDVWYHITNHKQQEIIIPFNYMIDTKSIKWKSRENNLPIPTDIMRIKKFNPWIPIKCVEDYLVKLIKK